MDGWATKGNEAQVPGAQEDIEESMAKFGLIGLESISLVTRCVANGTKEIKERHLGIDVSRHSEDHDGSHVGWRAAGRDNKMPSVPR
jgi:hypothetical protein